ncbi:MAG: iron-sulfur cluster assembly accessory protein [Proteobacteria bacterium]|nr:iron-sulfur cluster assembly accessory protein [Pseudomonadota bacterium]
MNISDKAAERIIGLVEEAGPANGLRIRVTGGGCSGLQYRIQLDEEKKGDKVFENGSAKLYVDRRSFLYVNGSTVDFSDDLVNAGFKVENPNVKSSCGCGESFVV